MRVCCIVNLRSGGNLGVGWRTALKSIKRKFTGQLEVIAVGEASLQDLFSNGRSDYDLVVICGGDGTFSSVLPYFLGSDIPLALMPLGTGNDLARELGVRKISKSEFLDWLQEVFEGPRKDISVWEFKTGGEQNHYFINYLSAGFDGDVIRFFDVNRRKMRWLSRWFGLIGNRALYGAGGLWHLFGKPLRNITLTGESHNFSLRKLRTLFFSNIGSVMGFATSHPESSAFDNKLELTVFPSWRHYLGLLIPFSPWKPIHYGGESEWRVQGLPENCYLQVDGESLQVEGSAGELSIRCAGTVRIAGAVSQEVIDDIQE